MLLAGRVVVNRAAAAHVERFPGWRRRLEVIIIVAAGLTGGPPRRIGLSDRGAPQRVGKANMRVLFAASEVAPFSKTGGLGDVVGALPRSIRALGHEVIVMSPLYRCVVHSGEPLRDMGVRLQVPVGGRMVEARLRQGFLPGSDVPVYFVDQPAYYARDGLYGGPDKEYADNCERFVFFCRATLEAIRALGLELDALHLHDWQAGLIAPYQKILYDRDPLVSRPATLMTIHNMAYQGVYWGLDMPLIGLDWQYFDWRQIEFHSDVNLLKGGIVFSDLVSTVSPTYAQEIQTPFQGFGLDGVLKERSEDVSGVINGVDYREWDPATDPELARTYSASDLSGKAECKAALQRELGLDETDAPLLSMIGRLTWQKAPDLVASALPALLDGGAQFALLGSGSREYEEPLERLAARYPGRMAALVGFDNGWAHRIHGGADMTLMASRFEPCGLVQLCAMRYGCVPVAHRTGGLADTVVDATAGALADGTATGFAFTSHTKEGVADAVARARRLYEDAAAWRELMKAGMARDWSWGSSARKYVELYERAAARRAARGADGAEDSVEA